MIRKFAPQSHDWSLESHLTQRVHKTLLVKRVHKMVIVVVCLPTSCNENTMQRYNQNH